MILQSGKFSAQVRIAEKNSHVLNAQGIRFHTIGIMD
jgi:hypothetical protein